MDPLRILLTGGSGFVGGAVCRGLVADGHHVVAILHRTPAPFEDPSVRWVEIDLAGDDASGHLVQLGQLDAVCHIAAAIPAGAAVDSRDVAAVNHCIDRAVLDLSADRGVPLLFASTTGVYGARRDGEPVDESTPPTPGNAYAEGKLETEEQGAALAAPFCALRLAAPYGPGQRTRTVLPIFVERAVAGLPLAYFGSGDREQSFVHVGDMARAFAHALDRRASGVFNIAAAEPVTMRQLAETVASAARLDPGYVMAAEQPDAQDGLRARYDITRAASLLGWAPEVSLDEGISRLVDDAVRANR